ncbi:MAG TPA: hypothetical protein DCQ98_05145 [Planctomycetaceae bacterium]|nr:hypothetical protein [Planctomycetaceae bacterium]HRF01934.1 hypothetical protein [Pirellulaceae bacterium]
MRIRIPLLLLLVLTCVAPVQGQTGPSAWQSRGGSALPAGSGTNGSGRLGVPYAPAGSGAVGGARIARTTPGAEVLPRTAGQVWRNYDISPFTRQFAPEDRPQQEIVDWILRETGTDLWFNEPLGILSASYDTLQVYQTPAVHAVIHEMVDRFVDPQSRSHVLTFQLVLVGSPAWRARAVNLLTPVDVRSDGVQGWVLSKENWAILLADLRSRSDFRELQGPNLTLPSGRTEVLTQTRPVDYLSWLQPPGLAGGYANPSNRSIPEGFSLEMSALRTLDGNHMEAVVKALINQVEKLQPVPIMLQGIGGQNQTVNIQVPQMVTWRLHERFKWPVDQVLLLSCGVIATPQQQPARGPVMSILGGDGSRADALLILEVKPVNESAALPVGRPGVPSATRPGVNNGGRY